MGGWVSREETSVHYSGTELFEIAAKWTPARGDSSGRFFGDIRDLSSVGKFPYCRMDSATMS